MFLQMPGQKLPDIKHVVIPFRYKLFYTSKSRNGDITIIFCEEKIGKRKLFFHQALSKDLYQSRACLWSGKAGREKLFRLAL